MLDASTLVFAAEALLIGLLGTPHCAAMCGTFALAATGGEDTRSALPAAVIYTLGKAWTYALLCAFAGSFSQVLSGARVVGWVVSVIAVLFAAAHIAGWIRPGAWSHKPSAWLGRLRPPGRHGRALAIGLSTALLPCGLVFAALAIAVASGSAVAGAIVGLAFGLGTSPGLIAIGTLGGKIRLKGDRARMTVAMMVLITGIGLATLRFATDPSATTGAETFDPSQYVCDPRSNP